MNAVTKLQARYETSDLKLNYAVIFNYYEFLEIPN